MDASSYLKRHGWRGDGHSLDHTGRGIRKPLLVSKKVDVLGEIPYMVRKMVNSVARTKPYVYQVRAYPAARIPLTILVHSI